MQNKVSQDKEFCTLCANSFPRRFTGGMQNPKSIRELLGIGGKRLGALKVRAEERTVVLEHVRAALPPELAQTVVSAGLEGTRLTLGVAGAVWAARLRYMTDDLRPRVGGRIGVAIQSIRIKVVPPRART